MNCKLKIAMRASELKLIYGMSIQIKSVTKGKSINSKQSE